MISPADMLLFAAVAREGSFTGAARRLGITKQTASERLRKLEDALGVRLLERTTRRLRVTDAATAYLERCAAIAAQIDEANAEVRRRQTEPAGTLRISAPVLYGRRYLAPVISDYLHAYPQVRAHLVLADRRVDLIEEGFDVAIRVGELDDSSLTARKLGDGYMYYVASPAFLRKHGVPKPNSLRSTRCIGTKPFETWSPAGVPSKIEPVLVVNDLEIACDAAIAGIGVARLPSLVAYDAVASGRLRVLFGNDGSAVRPVYAMYPSRQYLPAKVGHFVERLVTSFVPMPHVGLPAAPKARRRKA
jgi:DNA-binding transcriptional LysR family regulator